MDSFVLVVYASLAASRTLLQRLLAHLNFTLDSELLFCWCKRFQHLYINSNRNPLTKFISSSRSTEFKDILPWNISQMITKTIPISTRIVISHAMKRAILFLSLLESQWKLRQQNDQNFPKEGKPL